MENGKKINGKAVASLVVSCIAVLNCLVWYLAILCGIIGVVLGILALRSENKRQQDLAVAGIVVGGTGFALGVVAAVLYIVLFSSGGGGVPDWEYGADTALMAVRSVSVYFGF